MEGNQNEHSYRLDKLDEQTKELNENQTKLLVDVNKIDESVKSAHKRLDKAEKQTDAILKLGVSVEQLTKEIKEIVETYKNHDDRLTALESAPGKTAIIFLKKIFWVVLSAGLGFLFSRTGVI